ncbi:quercetin 2,3-dioxygenase, partial [Enterobacter cloacae complex sp. 2DZ2F16B1]
MEQYRPFLLSTGVLVVNISLFTSETDALEKAMKQITGIYTAPAQ